MKTQIEVYGRNEGEIHEIIFIEYPTRGFPHQVITREKVQGRDGDYYWARSDWDGFVDCANEIPKLYNSGGGGELKLDIKYLRGAVWFNPAAIKLLGELPATVKVLRQPRALKLFYDSRKTTCNPFVAGEVAYSYNYCELCGYESEDEECPEHYLECNRCWDYEYTETRHACADAECDAALCAECAGSNSLCEDCENNG